MPHDMMQPQQPYTGQIYQPTQGYTQASAQSFYGSNFEDEPPLLEGITLLWPKARTPPSLGVSWWQCVDSLLPGVLSAFEILIEFFLTCILACEILVLV